MTNQVFSPNDPKKIDEKHVNSKLTIIKYLIPVLIVLLIVGIAYFIFHLKPEKISTNYGEVMGVRRKVLGHKVTQFLGIPYAKPPIGDLRLKKPERPDSWPSTYYATELKPPCVQYAGPLVSYKFDKQKPSEDCLYLNLFVPGSKVTRTNNKSVMVFIHGGAFIVGRPHDYDGSVLAAYGDIIVVTFAYRLGALGFLNSGTDEMPGNYGLHDQLLALRWVKENIKYFGGNPDSITIFGESAGGISVGYHLVSSLSQYLFNRAIMESGSPLTPIMATGGENGPLVLEKVVKHVNCPYQKKVKGQKYSNFTAETFDCLRKAPVEKICEIQNQIIDRKRDTGFKPVEDGDFFKDHPLNLVRGKNFGPQTEILMGSNSNEGAFFLSAMMPDIFPRKAHVQSNLTFDYILERAKKIGPIRGIASSEFVREMLDSNKTEKLISNFDKSLTETLFLCPDISFIENYLLHNKKNKRKVYYYIFAHRPSTQKNFPWVKGATHHDEVRFVFGKPLIKTKHFTSNEIKLSKTIMTHFINFAKTGVPSTSWPPIYDSDEVKVKVYESNQTKILNNFPENRCDYYDELYDFVKDKYSYYER